MGPNQCHGHSLNLALFILVVPLFLSSSLSTSQCRAASTYIGVTTTIEFWDGGADGGSRGMEVASDYLNVQYSTKLLFSVYYYSIRCLPLQSSRCTLVPVPTAILYFLVSGHLLNSRSRSSLDTSLQRDLKIITVSIVFRRMFTAFN